jgi:ankyrin repeat protein
MNNSAAEVVSIARMQIGAWLCESGAAVNAANCDGNTVLHLALLNGHVPLAAALARKGGDLSLRNGAGASCMDMLSGPEEVEQVSTHFKLR